MSKLNLSLLPALEARVEHQDPKEGPYRVYLAVLQNDEAAFCKPGLAQEPHYNHRLKQGFRMLETLFFESRAEAREVEVHVLNGLRDIYGYEGGEVSSLFHGYKEAFPLEAYIEGRLLLSQRVTASIDLDDGVEIVQEWARGLSEEELFSLIKIPEHREHDDPAVTLRGRDFFERTMLIYFPLCRELGDLVEAAWIAVYTAAVEARIQRIYVDRAVIDLREELDQYGHNTY